jgi:DNA-binding CsgD family transcriptional regulator
LIRSAVVALSTSDQRRRAHRLLADLAPNDDLRSWHLSEATIGTDESVASLIENVALNHLNRGDAVRAVKAMSRAAELSPSTADRSRRWAQAAYIGATVLGDLRETPRVLDHIRGMDPDHAGALAAALASAYHLLNGDGDVDAAHRLLVGALEMFPDTNVAGDAHKDILIEAVYTLLEICHWGLRADLWPPFWRGMERLGPHVPSFLALLSKTVPDPARDALPVLDELDAAVAALPHESNPTRMVQIAVAGSFLDRLPQCRPALWRAVQDGRDGGAVTLSIKALALLGFDYYLTGQWDELTRITDECVAFCDEHSYGLLRWPSRFQQALLAAARGQSATAQSIADEVLAWAVPRRAGAWQTFALHARALDAIGRGDFENAYRITSAVSPAGTLAPSVPHAMWMVLDLVEAAMHTGRAEEASAHAAAALDARMHELSSRLALITHGAAGLAASGDDDAITHFELALGKPGVEQSPFDLARVQLAYGERLRRAQATATARPLLTTALDTFQRLGAAPWTERTRRELRATGIALDPTTVSGPASLTPQQLEIAQLAAQGLTNKEIGERLFLSHRTVSTHLYQLFPKLGITSRAALRDALTDDPARSSEEGHAGVASGPVQ